ncbi:GH92 family glycosyl hydrolase [Flavobacterium filum]|uniref:GH92 family glycosyl hydrolase n=1 Tax=Flavobacterium filum TaxID=370974 RepID=UPI0004053351|nr:GH92 family glycosyl hydrolase [Flavobacterium filum]
MRQFILSVFLFISGLTFSQNYQQYVNPFIGTGGTGHTFPGATVPYGMVQLSPDTRIDGSWEGCSGYHYSDNRIYGFSHTHLNGTGVSDYGDILLMPTMGEPSFDNKIYSSTFSHANEKASAGFYAVKLDKHNIDVRLTTSTRVGFHEYTFNESGLANIILDLNHRDKLLEGKIRVINDKTIEVLRRSEAWASNQYVYARIEFNQKMVVSKLNKSNSEKLEIIGMSFSKKVKKGEKILVKVALSPTGYDGAQLNSTEISHWDFNKVKKAAEEMWNKELSKIEVTSSDKNKLTILYTALYHTMMQPNIAQDLDGKYRGRDNKIHQAEGFDYYTVFSLWDTFRAAHPLYTLIDKKRTADYINTFIKQFEQGGRLPVWELASNETDCMIGYHSVSVIADAMVKGIEGFDYEKAYQAAKHSAMLDHLGLEAYKKQGFISIDDEHESVSKTLEYAYDDWCIAQMAQLLDKKEDYQYFMLRSQNWKNLFNWETGFIQPKKNGGWDKPFDPKEVNNNYTEANGWQYTFFVPQDILGLADAIGGPTHLELKLDEMFNSVSETSGRHQVDITGLIGQYAHGNEPSHHVAYLYSFLGSPEKTTEKVHFILDNFYKNDPDGLIGNEDCGQMSAWYVLSSMGMYNITPGQSDWTLSKPYFENIKVHFENGEYGEKSSNKEHDSDRFFGFWNNYRIQNDYKYKELITVPVIQAESKTFKDKMTIKIQSNEAEAKIYYLINEQGVDYSTFKRTFIEYTKPIEIDKTAEVHTYNKKEENQSNTVSATFFKKPNNFTIDIQSTYNPQYHAGGPEGLIDGIFGTENWRKGDWQGYQTQDFEAVIDMQSTLEINQITANFLQDTRSWILMPTKVEYYVSDDNVNFTLFDTQNNTIDPKEYKSVIKGFKSVKKTVKARYVKVKSTNFGKLPEWHQGFPFNGEAFMFVDEITVE